MKINWKLRFKNKATLTALLMAVIAFVYQILGIIGIAPKISESDAIDITGIIINVLVVMGIITDPTTAGVSDSSKALCYDCPAEESEVE